MASGLTVSNALVALGPHLLEIQVGALVVTLVFLLMGLWALNRALNSIDCATWREERNDQILERLSVHFASKEGGLPEVNRPSNPRKVSLAGPVQRTLKRAVPVQNEGFRRRS